MLIVSGTIFYSQYLARKISQDEKQKVEEWKEAGKFLLNDSSQSDIRLPMMILTENQTIPIIVTDEKDSITDKANLDSVKLKKDPSFIRKELNHFKSLHKPIEWTDPKNENRKNLYYYGDSKLLNEVRYYPLVQLFIVALFILITLFSLRSSYRSSQNQVWAGMAKETAHQLGTPVSSLEGWVEMLKEKNENQSISSELEKDVARLRLISDRFGKIGSTPHLEEVDLVGQISAMIDYMKKRATGKVNFVFKYDRQPLPAKVSPPLFDWVVENLLKNSLDAIEGKGSIGIDVSDNDTNIFVDVSDSGKGIARKNIPKVFKPGFTTKKRGWGLGLTLSRRIIEQYHHGKIFVKHSEPGKGTTFRIELKK
jgi:signal transduction histidine kinase